MPWPKPACRWKSSPLPRPPSKELTSWLNYLRHKNSSPAVPSFPRNPGWTSSPSLRRAASAIRPRRKPWSCCTCPIPTIGIRRPKTGTCPKTGNRSSVTPLRNACRSTAPSSCSWTSVCAAAPAPTSATSSWAPTTPRTCPCCVPSCCAPCTAATTPSWARSSASAPAPAAGTRKW